jgi:hypothetical protein
MNKKLLTICTFALPLNAAIAQELEKRPAAPVPALSVVSPAKMPNADPTYQALRNIGIGNESVSVNNLLVKRDAGEFTFHSGVFQFLAPVNGKITGAVFLGDGSFAMVPPIPSERRSLALLTKEPAIHEDFTVVVLRFTDGTYEEIKKMGTAAGAKDAGGAGELDYVKHALRKKLQYNLDARILQDVMKAQPGGLFYAFIKGKKIDGKEIFAVDPHGVREFAPEEVEFEVWSESRPGAWAAFHYSDEYSNGTANGTERNGLIAINQQILDTQLEKSGRLEGDARTMLTALQDGVRVVPLQLFPTLRVTSVSGTGGEALDFIQEGKNDDYQLSVILPKPLQKGESYEIRTIYGGKDAVSNEGGGNYYPLAREDWFPNTTLGNYSSYQMTFRIPKNLTMVATGTQTRSVNEGGQNITEWKSEVPQSVAGFNFGQFRRLDVKDPDFVAESYVNENPPDEISNLLAMSNTSMLGSLTTTGLNQKALDEAHVAMKIYGNYFGFSPYKRVAMTQQTACNYGQSWPTLVFLPICYYFDKQQQHLMRLDDDRGYWRVVAPHEVAHQWWGHAVGWASYRDQWMSEGFAEMSASIYIQAVWKNQKFIDFWKEERELMTEKNREGYRAIDVGPLTLGYRLNNARAGGDVARRLIYPKGGYVLHMLRMMMWDRNKGDERFREMMRDFVATYLNHPASTEDFKAMVEKHMTPLMDLDHNKKMDWFFNDYVYGTELPSYSFDYSIDNNMNLSFKLTQSNVSPEFKMLVPVYLELVNGQFVKLGTLPITGNKTLEQTVALEKMMKERPKRALINYYNDVLAMNAK